MAEVEERLLAALDDSDREVLEAFQDVQADMMGERDMANFVYGFRLCAKLILESLDERVL